jgi:hypothetical protein
MNSRVVLRRPRPAYVSTEESSPVFRLRRKAKDLHFSREHLPAFLILDNCQPHAVSDLLATCSSAQVRMNSLGLLMESWEKGIIIGA